MIQGLVISTTENILKYSKFLGKNFYSVDFLVLQENQGYDFGFIQDQIFFSPEGSSDFLSSKQQQVISLQAQKQKQRILNQMGFSKIVSISKSHEGDISGNQEKQKVYSFRDVIDLKYSKQERQYYLEMQFQNIKKYAFILVEQSLMVDELLKSKKIKLFKSQTTVSESEFVGFRYRINKPHSLRRFWKMRDECLNDETDNTYFVNLSSAYIDIWSYIPKSHVLNKDMQKYWAHRYLDFNEEQFKFLDIQRNDFTILRQAFFSNSLKPQMNGQNIFFHTPFHFWSFQDVQNNISIFENKLFKSFKKNIENTEKMNEANV